MILLQSQALSVIVTLFSGDFFNIPHLPISLQAFFIFPLNKKIFLQKQRRLIYHRISFQVKDEVYF